MSWTYKDAHDGLPPSVVYTDGEGDGFELSHAPEKDGFWISPRCSTEEFKMAFLPDADAMILCNVCVGCAMTGAFPSRKVFETLVREVSLMTPEERKGNA